MRRANGVHLGVFVIAAFAASAHAQSNKCPQPYDPHCQLLPPSGPSGKAMYCKDPKGPLDFKNCARPYAPPAQQQKGSIAPAYIIVSLLYVPPGAQSQTSYGAQSSAGSQSSSQNAFKGGLQIGTTGTLQVTVADSIQYTSGTTYEVDKSVGSTLSLTSTTDVIDHNKDTFVLWTNPELDATSYNDTDVEASLTTRSGQPMQFVELNLGELRELSGRTSAQVLATLPAAKQSALRGILPGEFGKIAALDPFIVMGATLDATRFQLVDTLQISGPDQARDPIPGFALNVSNQTIRGSFSQVQNALSVQVVVQTGFNFFGLLSAGVQAGGTVEWDYTSGSQTTQTKSQQASVTLQTPTVGYNNVVAVYYDTLFKSFAYVPQSNVSLPVATASASGVVTSGGAPAANTVVTVTSPGGQKRRVMTNAKGEYRVFALNEGQSTFSVGATSKPVTVSKGGSAKVGIEIGK